MKIQRFQWTFSKIPFNELFEKKNIAEICNSFLFPSEFDGLL